MPRGAVNKPPDQKAVTDSFDQLQLIDRIGLGREIAIAAPFLAGDDSSCITGADLLVDGGPVLGNAPLPNA